LLGPAGRPLDVWMIASILVMCGAALVIGFLTPLASVLVGLCVLGMSSSWFPGPHFTLFESRLVDLEMITTIVAIALLGPGAFSLDGYLFGRREIVIPPRPPDS
jgi:uncharacterized membrane protein YphA (DoxX/SURF4 family)